MGKRSAFLFLLILVVLSTTGCWDQVQIEERGFVIALAIDLPESEKMKRKAEQEAPDKPKEQVRFLVTHQFVIPGGLSGGSQGGGANHSSSGEAFLNLTSEGDSLFEISRAVAGRTSRSPFYQHLKVVIISEEVAKTKDAFAKVLDFTLRDPELRRSSKVMIAKGEARSTLEITPKNEKLPGMFINSIAENIKKNARMLPEERLGDVHGYMIRRFSYAIPRIVSGSDAVKIAGSAIFRGKNNQMVGYLGEEETEGLNFVTGKLDGGLLKALVGDNLVIFNVQGAKRTIEANTRDKEHIRFLISIECEGVIAESFRRIDFLDTKTIEHLQKKFEQEIERLANDTIKKVHKQMKVDALRLGSYLKQEQYQVWKQINKDWEDGMNLYNKSEIKVKAKVYIRNVGEVNRTKNR